MPDSVSPWMFLVLYAAVGAFGGGLQPVAVVEWFRPALLLQFLHRVNFALEGPHAFLGILFSAVLAQAISLTFANAGAFNDPDWSTEGVLTVFMICFICSLVLVPIVFGGDTAYRNRFPESALAKPFVFATLWTAVWAFASSYFPIGSFSHPAYSQASIKPVVLSVSLFGLEGLCFLMAWTAAVLHEAVLSKDDNVRGSRASDVRSSEEDGESVVDYTAIGVPSRKEGQHRWFFWHPRAVAIAVLSVLLYGGILQQLGSGHFFQRGIVETARPTFGASCIVGTFEDEQGKQRLLHETATRVSAGDDIIIWSETAAVVHTDQEEASLLQRVSSMALMGSLARGANSSGPYIGITYLKKLQPSTLTLLQTTPPSLQSYLYSHLQRKRKLRNRLGGDDPDFKAVNSFVLIGPTGGVVLAYNKSHPVPVVEAEVVAGAPVLKVADTPYGRVGAAICFDLDFPEFVRQAGQKRAAILLQPAWTWGPLPAVDFDGDGFRAVENGLLWFRCSSFGISGATDHLYNTLLYREVLDSGVVTARLPMTGAHTTPYVVFGFCFKYLVQAAAVAFLLLALLPLRAVHWLLVRLPSPLFFFITGHEVDRLRELLS